MRGKWMEQDPAARKAANARRREAHKKDGVAVGSHDGSVTREIRKYLIERPSAKLKEIVDALGCGHGHAQRVRDAMIEEGLVQAPARRNK